MNLNLLCPKLGNPYFFNTSRLIRMRGRIGWVDLKPKILPRTLMAGIRQRNRKKVSGIRYQVLCCRFFRSSACNRKAKCKTTRWRRSHQIPQRRSSSAARQKNLFNKRDRYHCQSSLSLTQPLWQHLGGCSRIWTERSSFKRTCGTGSLLSVAGRYQKFSYAETPYHSLSRNKSRTETPLTELCSRVFSKSKDADTWRSRPKRARRRDSYTVNIAKNRQKTPPPVSGLGFFVFWTKRTEESETTFVSYHLSSSL